MRPADDHISDQECFRRFVETGEEGFFQVLVERHKGMILRICRTNLGNLHDLELDRLPTKYRECLSLRFLAGPNIPQIGVSLGCAEHVARFRVEKGRAEFPDTFFTVRN